MFHLMEPDELETMADSSCSCAVHVGQFIVATSARHSCSCHVIVAESTSSPSTTIGKRTSRNYQKEDDTGFRESSHVLSLRSRYCALFGRRPSVSSVSLSPNPPLSLRLDALHSPDQVEFGSVDDDYSLTPQNSKVAETSSDISQSTDNRLPSQMQHKAPVYLPLESPSYAVVEQPDGRLVAPNLGVEWPKRPSHGPHSRQAQMRLRYGGLVACACLDDEATCVPSIVCDEDEHQKWDPFSDNERTPPLVFTATGQHRHLQQPVQSGWHSNISTGLDSNSQIVYRSATDSDTVLSIRSNSSSSGVQRPIARRYALLPEQLYTAKFGDRFLGVSDRRSFTNDLASRPTPGDYAVFLDRISWTTNPPISTTACQILEPNLQLTVVYRPNDARNYEFFKIAQNSAGDYELEGRSLHSFVDLSLLDLDLLRLCPTIHHHHYRPKHGTSKKDQKNK